MNIGGMNIFSSEAAEAKTLTSQFDISMFPQQFYLDVSKNSGTPKSSILIGFSIINHPFWGTPIFGNTHMFPVRLPTFVVYLRIATPSPFHTAWNQDVDLGLWKQDRLPIALLSPHIKHLKTKTLKPPQLKRNSII